MGISKKDSKTRTGNKEDEFLGQPDDKKLLIRMHKEMWEQLRRLAFETNNQYGRIM